jgi:putative copper resistance protein D
LSIAMLANICGLWLEAAAMAEVPVAQAADATWSMLTATHFGTAWTIGISALIFSAGALALGRHPERTWRLPALNLLGLAVFLFTRSMVSHASADGDFGIPVIVDWLHLMLICIWVGEVFVAGFLTLASPPGTRTDDRDDCVRYIKSLSASATLALVGIFATGLYSAWHNVGSPGALVGNAYGTTLLFKLALVALAVTLGGMNRFVVMQSLIAALHGKDPATTSAMRPFTLILRIEAGVLLGVLILASILSSTSPPTAG